MARATRPASRDGFETAVMCALTIEANAVEALFDRHWDDEGPSYDKAPNDPNAYSLGAIGRHNVVLVHLPGMGKANAAAVVANCRASFPNIKLALVVGVCGAAPFVHDTRDEIVLGDVIISDGIVQYDLGQRLPDRFLCKDTLLDSLGRPNMEIRSLLAKLKGRHGRTRLQTKMASYLHELQTQPDLKAHYPGSRLDQLFKSTYRHRRDGALCEECGRRVVSETCGCGSPLIARHRLDQSHPQPAVHFGLIASGDTVMKAGEERDKIVQQEGVVGFEMEGAGVWDSYPCVVIKGACDYADSHKTKRWQSYAAATAAACAKAFLDHWAPPVASGASGASGTDQSSASTLLDHGGILGLAAPTFKTPRPAWSIETGWFERTEPLSVAAFAIQIVEFGAKVLSRTAEIGGRGRIVDTKALTEISKGLKTSWNDLQGSLGPVNTSSNDSLANLASECQSVAAELHGALDTLSESVDRSKWGSIRQAMLTIWPAERIDGLERKLDTLRKQLIHRILESLREQLRELYAKGVTNKTSLDVEIGRSFLNHLGETELLQHKVVKDIEDRLLQEIQSQHGAMTGPGPPQEVFERQKRRFLQSLQYTEMDNRRDRIPIAARKTFEWVYRVPDGVQEWSSFVDWLREDGGIYWVTGKPGSGKSTLMKFLQDDARTNANLGQWSKDRTLVCASFYFWNSGTEIQMSNEGLLKSLLHQVCKAAPDLIHELFPDRWETLSLFGSTNKPWTISELLGGLRMLSTSPLSARRFFFLIDGLDEFEGDKSELIELVKAMVACRHVKVCVSSRPWVEFREAFESNPNLRLEDLTSHDIGIYIESKFNGNKRFPEIRRRHPVEASELFAEIANRSSGVFLWVHLVVKSLLQGISNGDRFSDLRKRLAELPSDLENLFHKILASIEPRYKHHASHLFHIHREHGSISLLRLAFADEDDECLSANDVHTLLSTDDFIFKCTEMKNRIDSRTKGLLEVTKWAPVEPSYKTHGEVPAGFLNRWQVQYLHRTVRDFFSRPEIWLALSEAAPGFDPYLSLCRAFILEVKYLRSGAESTDILQQYVNSALMFASMADAGSRKTLVAHLDAANSITASLMKQGPIKLTPLDSHLPARHAALFAISVEFDLDFYIDHLLSNGHPVLSRQQYKPYVSFAIEKHFPKTWDPGDVSCLGGIRFLGDNHPVSSKTLRVLIQHGATLYDKCNEEPYLKHLRLEFAETCFKVLSSRPPNIPLMEHWLDVVELLVSVGADPSSFWRILPLRKVEELDRLIPQLGLKLRQVLQVAAQKLPLEDRSGSPRLRAIERRRRRRAAITTNRAMR